MRQFKFRFKFNNRALSLANKFKFTNQWTYFLNSTAISKFKFGKNAP